MPVGEAVIYLLALPWLALHLGPARAVPLGPLPFIPGDAESGRQLAERRRRDGVKLVPEHASVAGRA